MDAFPQDYIVHNLPLILLSGLEDDRNDAIDGDKSRNLLREGGFRIKTDILSVKADVSLQLLKILLSHDSSEEVWNSQRAAQTGSKANFRIRSIGRLYTLPPRKAPPPPHSPRLRAGDNASPPPPMILHSVLSPLSPSSPLYPDGIMSPLWVAKHQSLLPSIFISFFVLSSDQTTSTLQDNKLKSEIHNIRNLFSTTTHKTKFVCVLMGEAETLAVEVDERISNIRRATGLDNKSLFFIPTGATSAELAVFANTLLSTLYPVSIEYYRDLSKHARRKRNRSAIPQPTVQPTSGTSQVLGSQGWNVRYEFKLGVFAEFRQEMDAAVRNYETAYENLFGPELFDAVPLWSPRFNESRLLADIIAIRVIRCMLWIGQATNAVKWWTGHRDRIRDIVSRRGTGTENYGWESWQTIWSRTMAELIQRTHILSQSESGPIPAAQLPVMLHAEKLVDSADRFTPWQSLHHPGYWLNLARQHVQKRRYRAHQMPEEDRTAPGQSPASAIANKAHLYDKYLTLEPHREFPVNGEQGYDYQSDIIADLDSAIQHFSACSQPRMAMSLQYQKASELIQSSSWDQALTSLLPVWENHMLKESGWWTLLAELGRVLLTCASEARSIETLISLNWELSQALLSSTSAANLQVNRAISLVNRDVVPQVALSTDSCISQVVSQFAFATDEGYVGKSIVAQLSLKHNSPSGTTALISEIKMVFEGGLRPLYLVHKDKNDHSSSVGDVQILDVQVFDDANQPQNRGKRSSIGTQAHLTGFADLALSPGQTKVLQLELTPLEPGEILVVSATLQLDPEGYQVSIITPREDIAAITWWETRSGKAIPRLCGKERNVVWANVLPKPPKLDVVLPHPQSTYYTNEDIELVFDVLNLEDENISGSIEIRLISANKNVSTVSWPEGEPATAYTSEDGIYMQSLSPLVLSDIPATQTTSFAIHIANTLDAIDHELEVIVTYVLASNPEIALKKMLVIDIPIVRPFEANFAFQSRHHHEPWPDFFTASSVSQDSSEAVGIKQQFLVSATICSFAIENISIESTDLINEKILGGILCTTAEGRLQEEQSTNSSGITASSSVQLPPEQTKKFTFDMTLQKIVLGDRQPAAVDLMLQITWKRSYSDRSNVTTLQVPRFLAPSSEPRVLARVSQSENIPGVYCLDYTIENPTMHFLTFNLAMESHEDFAFSGPKNKSISLVPMSRHEFQYRVVPNKPQEWLRVNLEVVDAYFGQTLKVQPASTGIKVDKQGNVQLRLSK